MVQKSGEHQLRLVGYLPLFARFQHHPRWLFGISEPSTTYDYQFFPPLLLLSLYRRCRPLAANWSPSWAEAMWGWLHQKPSKNWAVKQKALVVIGYFSGMKSYPVIWGLFHKPWNSYKTTSIYFMESIRGYLSWLYWQPHKVWLQDGDWNTLSDTNIATE